MTLFDWLDCESGRLTAMAEHFGLTASAVSQWRTNGVPLSRMQSVSDYTGGVVAVESMIRDQVDLRFARATA